MSPSTNNDGVMKNKPKRGTFATLNFTGAVVSGRDLHEEAVVREEDVLDDDDESSDGLTSDGEEEEEEREESYEVADEVTVRKTTKHAASGSETIVITETHSECGFSIADTDAEEEGGGEYEVTDDELVGEEADKPTRGMTSKRVLCLFLIALLLIVVGIVVGVVIVGREESAMENINNNSPTQYPSRPFDWSTDIADILASHGITDPDPTAFEWMAHTDTWFMAQKDTEWVDRYGMVSFLQKAGKSEWLRPGVTHCYWNTVTCNGVNQVTYLDLRSTGLTMIPTELGILTSLTQLSFQNDPIAVNGRIPPGITQLTNLENLFMKNTGVTEIGAEILTMRSLNSFLMEEQPLVPTTIPFYLYSLTKLEELKLRDCSLEGTIQSEIGQLSELTNLALAQNQLRGPFPVEMDLLSNLKRFVAGSNSWSTSFPPWFGQLTKLEELKIGDSNLEGELPIQIAQLTSLTSLNLRRNSLSGMIPPLPTSLSECTLELNNFTNTANYIGPCTV